MRWGRRREMAHDTFDMAGLPGFTRVDGLLLREGPGDAVAMAVFEDAIPTVTERRRILERGYGLHVLGVPAAHRDLTFLSDFLGLTALSVTGVDYDTRPVSEITTLEHLSLEVFGAPETDLRPLTSLTSFAGAWETNQSVFEIATLERASFHDVEASAVTEIPAHLLELDLASAPRIRSLHGTRDGDAALRRLSIDRARLFDATSLTTFPHLSALAISDVTRLVGTAALADLPLRELGLLNCRHIADMAELARLTNVRATVTGRLAASIAEIRTGCEPPWEYTT